MNQYLNGYDAAVSASNEPRLPRRTVVTRGASLGVGLGAGLALLASGCSVGHDNPVDQRSRSAKPSADVATIDTAAGLLEESIARLSALAPAPAPVAASLRLHQVHLSRLQGVNPASTQPTPSTTTYPRHLGPAAHMSERKLVHQLSGFAQRAESGDLARLFAAMAAATSQRLDAWPTGRGAR